MRYVLGVDGRQQCTTAVVADETGSLLGVGHGTAVARPLSPIGAEQARRAVSAAVSVAVAMADLQNARIAAACLGVAESQEDMEGICAPVVPAAELVFGGEDRLALYSFTGGRPGVAVVADRGVRVFGVNARGVAASAGGWGPALGDEGSACWIGIRALNACCRASDGSGPQTDLATAILRYLEYVDLTVLKLQFASSAIDLASLHPVVVDVAAQGDRVASRILWDAGKELGGAVGAVLQRLNMSVDAPRVGTVGSVFRGGRLVLRSFRAAVQRLAPTAAVSAPRLPGAVGAAIVALETLSGPVGSGVLENLEATACRLPLRQ